jgi:hypothetical protein
MWFRSKQHLDWISWAKAAAITAFVLVACPTMIYFAWPADAQAPPGGVNGNCNNFGNYNTNCNTFNFSPPPLQLTEKSHKIFFRRCPTKRKL